MLFRVTRYSGRVIGLSFLYVCSFSLITGLILFGLTWKWFVVADLLRATCISSTLLLPVFVFPKRWGKLWLCLLYLVLLLASSLNLWHILIYDTPITTMAVQSILETTPAEGAEFVAEFFSVPFALLQLVLVALPLALLRKLFQSVEKKWQATASSLLATLAVGILGIVMLFSCMKKGERLMGSHEAYAVYMAVVEHQGTMARYSASDANLKTFTGISFVDSAGAPSTYVFVIGESANRNHLGVYGYFRDTTPKLHQRHKELLFFPKIISGATHTIPSLRKILLLQGDETASLIDLFNQANFKTFWLSNQTVAAEGKYIGTSQIASRASVKVYKNMARDEGRSTQTDEVLLPELQKALHDPAPNKVIFLHLLGSHLQYALRYPPSFGYFQDDKDIPKTPWRKGRATHYINAYDNSIRYTDHVLDQVIAMMEKRPEQSFVLYFSDHGQEVYDIRPLRGQVEKNPTRNMLDVPFILWLSDAYRKSQWDFVRQLEMSVGRAFIMDNFTHSAAELARIRFDDWVPALSLWNENFQVQELRAPRGELYEQLDR